MSMDNGKTRTFDTGATRNTAQDKLDYEGFLSPLALARFARYMHENRVMADGTMRESDNWQRGIPVAEYLKSLWRHMMELWAMHRGWPGTPQEKEDALCAIIFNVQGYLHESLKAREQRAAASTALPPTPTVRVCPDCGYAMGEWEHECLFKCGPYVYRG